MNEFDVDTEGHSCLPPVGPKRRRWLRTVSPNAAICLVLLIGGCSMQQARFGSPEEAVDAFVLAVRSEDSKSVRHILGRDAADMLPSGDDVADRQLRERFLEAYDEKNALVSEEDGSVTLEVGQDDWPMPIPIVSHRGSWYLDTERGVEEIFARRIGRNELAVQQICLAIVDAQRDYAAIDPDGDGVHEYAQKFISDPGQKNGLYWEISGDEPPSPLGPLVVDAAQEGYSTTPNTSGELRPFHGYYFKLLKSQGRHAPGGARDYVVNGKMTEGFAVVAWPAIYDNSGVMTFLVSHQGVVYERDLGPRTERIAASMSVFDPDSHWSLE